MNTHRKKMQKEWEINTKLYQDPIGMTGRRPVKTEFQEMVQDVSDKFALNSPEIHHILDAGCSNGFLLKQMNPDVDMVVGLDFCMAPLLEGSKQSSGIRFVQGEITCLPFSDNQFDRVICYSLFHYLPSLEVVFNASSELFRVLSKSGRLLIGDLLSADHRHLIPKSDLLRWNSKERSFMHRLENWTFVHLKPLEKHFLSSGATLAEIKPQIRSLRENNYRFDLIVEK